MSSKYSGSRLPPSSRNAGRGSYDNNQSSSSKMNNSRVSLSLSDLQTSPTADHDDNNSPYPNTSNTQSMNRTNETLDIHIGGTVGDIAPEKMNYRKELGKLLKKSRGTAYESTLRKFVEQKYREMKQDEEEHQARLRTMRNASPFSSGDNALHYRSSRFDSSSPSRRQFSTLETRFSISEGDTNRAPKLTAEERQARIDKMATPREAHRYKGPASEINQRFPSPTNTFGRQRPGPPLRYPSPTPSPERAGIRSPSSLMGSSIRAPITAQYAPKTSNSYSLHVQNQKKNSTNQSQQKPKVKIEPDFRRTYNDFATAGKPPSSFGSKQPIRTARSQSTDRSIGSQGNSKLSKQRPQHRARTPSPAPSTNFKSWIQSNQEWQSAKKEKLQQRMKEAEEMARQLPSTPKLTRKSVKLAELAEKRELHRMQLNSSRSEPLFMDDDFSATASKGGGGARSTFSAASNHDDETSAALAITTDEEASATERAQSPASRSVYDRLAQRSRQYAQKNRQWEPPQLESHQFPGSPYIGDYSRKLAQRKHDREVAASLERLTADSNRGGCDPAVNSSNTSEYGDGLSRANTPTSGRRARSASPYTATTAGRTTAITADTSTSNADNVSRRSNRPVLRGSGLSQLKARAAQQLAAKQEAKMKHQIKEQSQQRSQTPQSVPSTNQQSSLGEQPFDGDHPRNDSLNSAGTADVDFFDLYGARSRHGSVMSVHDNALNTRSDIKLNENYDTHSAPSLHMNDLNQHTEADGFTEQENRRLSPNIDDNAKDASDTRQIEPEEKLLFDDSAALRQLTRESLRKSKDKSRERKMKELAQLNRKQYGTEKLPSPPKPFQPMIGSETHRIMSRVKSSFTERNARMQEVLLVRKELSRLSPSPGPGHYNKLDKRNVKTAATRSTSPGNRGYSFGREPSGRLEEVHNNNLNGTFTLTGTGNISNLTGSRFSPNRRSKLL